MIIKNNKETIIANGKGFYKSKGDGLNVYYATNVYGPTYTLLSTNETTYTYPIDGWVWYDSEDIARTAFGLPSVEAINAGIAIPSSQNNISCQLWQLITVCNDPPSSLGFVPPNWNTIMTAVKSSNNQAIINFLTVGGTPIPNNNSTLIFFSNSLGVSQTQLTSLITTASQINIS